ncbi:MAG TPA: protein kinase, partial [Polyangiaceae bacterium]|nr:protein kinase [Polyangiaceae bacterium]
NMSRDAQVGTLVSEGGDKTLTPDEQQHFVAEARRRSWLGLEQGEILGGRFRIQELIQSGGMGDVYRATDLVDNTHVAVKTLRSGGVGVRRFEREATLLSELTHPGIPRYITHDLRAEQGPYLVMEWLQGTTLADFLRHQKIGVQSSLKLITAVAEAVAAAHERGLIHRDINPSNIFLVREDLEDVRVLDFGVARLTHDEFPLTAEGTQIGTPGYMAPEQVEGSAQTGPAADVFALGCVLYELTTGQRAFTAPTIRELLNRILTENPTPARELNHLIHPGLERLVARCLEKEPELRPKDAATFVALLQEIPFHDERAEESARPSRSSVHSLQQVTSVIVLRGTEIGLFEKVKQTARPFGLRVHQGTDATIVASTQGRGTAGDHAVTAARCALSIQRGTRVPTVAVATGLFLQHGEVPSGRAFDSALVSLLLRDRGNEPSTGGAALWLDENTASLLDSRFDVRQVEQGYLLRGLRDTHEPSRTVLGRRTRCVGRRRELSMLQATLSESFEDGVASSVLVTGPPGVGKTRLVSELTRLARRDRPGLEVLRAHGESLTSGAPMAILSQLIAHACHIKDDDPQPLRARKLKQYLARTLSGSELQRVAGFLAELLGISTDDFDSQELRVARRDAVLKGDQINRAIEDWLRAECSKDPRVIVLDDFQWGDLATVKVIDNLLRNLSEQRLVVVCLARPEVHELFPKLWVRRGVTELRLGGISRRAASSMIEEILGQDVPEPVVERVIQRAQGNPFWIEELLRAEKSGQGESVPDRVVLLAQSRIEQLSILERRVLEAGSVFGRRFSEPGVAAVVGADLSSSQIKDALRELVDNEVLVSRDAHTQATDLLYEFSSGLLRDAAYSLVDGDDREEAHCRAAEHLEKTGDAEHLAVALHFSLGGALDRARPHYLGAADQALSADDMENAVACAEEGLSCGAQGLEAARLYLIHAEANKWRGDHAAALSSAKKAVDVAVSAPDLWFRALGEAAVAAGKLGQRGLAVDLGQQLLTAQSGHDLEERRIALSRVATQMSLMGNIELARELIDAAEQTFGSIEPDPRVLGFIEEARAVVAGAEGDPIGRIVHADASVQYFELAGDHRNACFLRLSQGFAEVELGDNERAVTSLTEAVRVAERMGLENSIPVGQAQLGRAKMRLGLAEEA